MSTKCTILVSSCDAYKDIIPPFLKLLKKYWPDLPYDIAISTESTEHHDDKLNIINLHPSAPDLTWTERIYDAVTKINSDQIFLLCDDFFLYDQVDSAKISEIIDWLAADSGIASFTLWPLLYESFPSKYPGFAERQKRARYKVAVIAGLWNKKWLEKYLRGVQESAWQFEPRANERSYKMLNPGKFYALVDSQDHIFPYNFMTIGLFSGQWLPDTKRVFKENGISIDYSLRGFFDSRFPSTHTSTQQAFSIDSRILPNRYYQSDDYSFITPVKNTLALNHNFTQTYKLHLGRDCVRWVIANQTGFAINNLSILVTYKSGATEIISNDLLFGTFIRLDETFVFNYGLPIIFILTRPGEQIRAIEFSGQLNFPAEKSALATAYQQETVLPEELVPPSLNQNWLEYALSEENIGLVVMRPHTSFYRDDKLLKEHQAVPFLGGDFSYSYDVPTAATRMVSNPSDKIGFYIKNLKIIQESPTATKIISGKNLAAYLPVTSDGIFCRLSDQTLDLDLIPGCTKVTITGTMEKPIPSALMRQLTNTHP